MNGYRNLLVSDFDGTITRHDFYELALPTVGNQTAAGALADWRAGRITHFEAMNRIFSAIRCDHATIQRIVGALEPDPQLLTAVNRLRAAGWDVAVVSAGSSWYIHQVLKASGVDVAVHASPATFTPETGLVMELPVSSPFFSQEMGISKEAVVRHGLENYERVAFAGNGPPDVDPALLVDPKLRFARTYLAAELTRRREGFIPFDWWSDVAGHLLGRFQS